MAEYIIDASIVAQRLIRDTYTENARRLFNNLTEADVFYIPEFCLLECVNVTWKQVRFHAMPQSAAQILVADLALLPFRIIPIEEGNLLPHALEIGLAQKLPIYDSIYIALAEKYLYPLITADAKQEAAAKAVGVTTKPITDF